MCLIIISLDIERIVCPVVSASTLLHRIQARSLEDASTLQMIIIWVFEASTNTLLSEDELNGRVSGMQDYIHQRVVL